MKCPIGCGLLEIINANECAAKMYLKKSQGIVKKTLGQYEVVRPNAISLYPLH